VNKILYNFGLVYYFRIEEGGGAWVAGGVETNLDGIDYLRIIMWLGLYR
jgi:hypothetical protein